MKLPNSIPTLIDYAILGLIQAEPLSGYRIRKTFETTALGNYSSSPGTIYPALKRLQKFELVEKIKPDESSKTKFKITQKGLQTLREWLLQPLEKIEIEKKVDELILRFAFMETLVDESQKIHFLTSFRDLLSSYIDELNIYHTKESSNMPFTARLAFEHGIATYKATLKWCKKAIMTLEHV